VRYIIICSGLFLIVVSIIINNRVTGRVSRAYEQHKWRAADASVEKIEYADSYYGSGYCELIVSYRFHVNDREYRGRGHAVTHGLLRKDATSYIESSLMKNLTVYYNPLKPQENALERFSFLLANAILFSYILMLCAGTGTLIAGIVYIYKGY